MPGVLPGSEGPLYYPPSEIHQNHEDWNGIPILINHPYKLGQPVSGRDPEILNKQQVGFVFHTTVDNDSKLKSELWFDEDLTQKVDPQVYKHLKAGNPQELSTGLFTHNVPAAPGSNYKGNYYTHVATNYRPDHLAVLPNQKGACDLKAGCGVLVNSRLTFNYNSTQEYNMHDLTSALVGNAIPPSMSEPNTSHKGSPGPNTQAGPPMSPDGSQPDTAKMVPTPESVRASTATKEAVRASGNANLAGLDTKYGLTKNTPEAHSAAVEAHNTAAEAHEKAAKFHNEIGNTEDSMSHAQHAMSHHSASKVHSKLVDDCMEKLGGRPYKMAANSMNNYMTQLAHRLVRKLTANCDCPIMLKFVKNDDGSMGVEEGEGEESGSNDLVDMAAMAKVLKVKNDPKRDPRGYINSIMSGMDMMGKALKGDNADSSRPSGKGMYQGEGQGKISSTMHGDEREGMQGDGSSAYEEQESMHHDSNPNHLNSAIRSDQNGMFTDGNLATDEGHELNAFNGPGGMGIGDDEEDPNSSVMPSGEDGGSGMPPGPGGADAGDNPGAPSSGMGRKTDPNKQDAAQRQPVGNTYRNNGGLNMSNFRKMLEHASPAEKAVWNHAVEITEREKQNLIKRILSPLGSIEHKRSVYPVYNAMGIEQLRAIAATVQVPVNNGYGSTINPMMVPNPGYAPAPVANYQGAASPLPHQVTPQTEIPSQPIQNGQEIINNQSNLLPLPRIDFEYNADYGDKGKRRRKLA